MELWLRARWPPQVSALSSLRAKTVRVHTADQENAEYHGICAVYKLQVEGGCLLIVVQIQVCKWKWKVSESFLYWHILFASSA